MALMAVLTAAPAQASPALEFPIEIRQGFLWAEVNISLSPKPLHFLLDTGASASVMDIGSARELGLKLADTVSVSGVQSKISGRKLQRCHLKSGEVPLPSPLIAIDLSQLSQACQSPVDGLIGADFFRHHIVEIDSAPRKVRLRHSLLKAETNEALPLEMRACGMRVPITINGRKMQWVRLDTGCASALQWVSSGVPADGCLRQTAIGLSQLSIPQIQTTVSMGDHTFTKVPTGLHTTAIFPGESGLIGNGLLLRFSKIIVDGKSNRLILCPLGRSD